MFKDKMIKLLEPTALEIVFMQLKEGTNKIILWQSSAGGNNKNSIHVRLAQVNTTKAEMTFFPMRGEFSFHPDHEIYFFGYRRTTIFKASISHYSKTKLVINLPTEVMLNNSRKEDRQDQYQNQAMIHYTFNSAMSSGLERLYLHSRLIDLSPTGLSFKSPRGNSIRFKKGEHLWIRSPQKENKYLVEGEIRHVTNVSDLTTREKYLRVGVSYVS